MGGYSYQTDRTVKWLREITMLAIFTLEFGTRRHDRMVYQIWISKTGNDRVGSDGLYAILQCPGLSAKGKMGRAIDEGRPSDAFVFFTIYWIRTGVWQDREDTLFVFAPNMWEKERDHTIFHTIMGRQFFKIFQREWRGCRNSRYYRRRIRWYVDRSTPRKEKVLVCWISYVLGPWSGQAV